MMNRKSTINAITVKCEACWDEEVFCPERIDEKKNYRCPICNKRISTPQLDVNRGVDTMIRSMVASQDLMEYWGLAK